MSLSRGPAPNWTELCSSKQRKASSHKFTSLCVCFWFLQGKVGDVGPMGFPGPPGPEVRPTTSSSTFPLLFSSASPCTPLFGSDWETGQTVYFVPSSQFTCPPVTIPSFFCYCCFQVPYVTAFSVSEKSIPKVCLSPSKQQTTIYHLSSFFTSNTLADRHSVQSRTSRHFVEGRLK